MKLGIQSIAYYLPAARQVNQPEKWGMDHAFLSNTVGVLQVARKAQDEGATRLCLNAYEKLKQEVGEVSDCQVLVVVTQNPDTNMPHTSAILHRELKLPASCVCFDISLGCTGFVHGLSIIQSFMAAHGFSRGLLFNVEVMSKIVNPNDRATAPIFGDGATVALISNEARFRTLDFTFGTVGSKCHALRVDDGVLFMEGQEVYEFVARNVPRDIQSLLARNDMKIEDIDRFVFHQGSKRTVDKLIQTLKLDRSRTPFEILNYGNIGACSVPILLADLMPNPDVRKIVMSGFGVGLAWSSAILVRT